MTLHEFIQQVRPGTQLPNALALLATAVEQGLEIGPISAPQAAAYVIRRMLEKDGAA
jgi:hypothetical protein